MGALYFVQDFYEKQKTFFFPFQVDAIPASVAVTTRLRPPSLAR